MAHAVGVDETVACATIGSGEATERLLEVAGAHYRTVSASADRIHFARAARPTWALVLGIILAPIIIGIPLLLIRTTETWVAAIEQDHRRVQVRVTGMVLPDTMNHLVEALSAGPRQADIPAVQAAVYDVVPAGAMHGGISFAPPVPRLVLDQTPLAIAVSDDAAAPGVAAASSVWADPSAEWTSPEIPASGTTRPLAGMGVSDRTMLRLDHAPEDRTMLRAAVPIGRPSEGTRYLAVFDTGECLELLDGITLFVGRDPEVIGSIVHGVLVPIDDPSRSISKTHLSIECTGDAVVVSDLGSTNGSTIRRPGAARPDPLDSRTPVAAPSGAQVCFGERSFVLEARVGSGVAS